MKRRAIVFILAVFIALWFLGGCNLPSNNTPAPTATSGNQPTASPTPTAVPSATPQPTVTTTNLPTATATVSATPDPYLGWTIPYLQSRTYGGGSLEVVEVLAENSYFTRYLVRYPSDGLDIYGFANVPVGEAVRPVIIAIHGYIDPEVYTTIDYTTRYADDLARRGYVVIHPNLRNYPPSGLGENLFRVGMAVDILNLIAIVRDTAGNEGAIVERIDPERIGLWGHSMGGGISTRVMTVDENIDAVVLYAAMSGDEQKNFEAILSWSEGERGREELIIPGEALARISPENYFDQVRAAVSIHHGLSDELVPVQWSRDTCEQLAAAAAAVECTYYAGQPHTFWGEEDLTFMENVAIFFEEHLGGTP